MKIEEQDKIHFNGLNTLRFFAALSVYLAHVELTKYFFGVPHCNSLFEQINFGGMGVYFFFVLSGFLITYLLCVEKNNNLTISIKYFYIRRILRIWPLYFLLVFLGFVILPNIDFFVFFPGSFKQNYLSNLFLYVFMFPNLAFSSNPPVAHIGQLWSIGAEEQFYLFWPVVVLLSKKLMKVIVYLFASYLLIKCLIFVTPVFLSTENNFKILKNFFAMNKFESMMIGSMGAVLLIDKKDKLIRILYNPILQVMALVSFPFLSYFSGNDNYLQKIIHLPVSFLFLVIIINFGTNKSSLLKGTNSLLEHLGKISYGIYMYHFVIIFIYVKIFLPLFMTNPLLANIIVYPSAFVSSCIVAHLSYNYFEIYFINLKAKFTKVQSG